MAFIHELTPPAEASADARVLVLAQDRQLAQIAPDGSMLLPTWRELDGWSASSPPALYLGRLDGGALWLHTAESADLRPPVGWMWYETRALLQSTTAAQAQAIACARQLHWWRNRHRFCGCCGAATQSESTERVLRCPACGASYFPSAFPAVIVAVTQGDRLLLAHNRNFRPGMFSLLAGFLDPGETFEQAVAREVREEVGIEIGDIRYMTSQPWAFPNSIMAGFRATHVSGEIRVDGQEIVEAGWYARDALPDIPRRGTVARELINGWLSETGVV